MTALSQWWLLYRRRWYDIYIYINRGEMVVIVQTTYCYLFPEWKTLNIIYIFIEICSTCLTGNISIDLVNVIFRSNDDSVHSLSELIGAPGSKNEMQFTRRIISMWCILVSGESCTSEISPIFTWASFFSYIKCIQTTGILQQPQLLIWHTKVTPGTDIPKTNHALGYTEARVKLDCNVVQKLVIF